LPSHWVLVCACAFLRSFVHKSLAVACVVGRAAVASVVIHGVLAHVRFFLLVALDLSRRMCRVPTRELAAVSLGTLPTQKVLFPVLKCAVVAGTHAHPTTTHRPPQPHHPPCRPPWLGSVIPEAALYPHFVRKKKGGSSGGVGIELHFPTRQCREGGVCVGAHVEVAAAIARTCCTMAWFWDSSSCLPNCSMSFMTLSNDASLLWDCGPTHPWGRVGGAGVGWGERG
jgi:hypothetical protein